MTFAKTAAIADIPCQEPGLGFEQYAEVLANLLSTTQPPQLTVGIFGGYGSGKTTLMKAIKRKLDSPGDPTLITVEFNAWRHDHEKHLFLPFLATIHRNKKISCNSAFSHRLYAAWRGFIQGLSFEAGVEFAQCSLKVGLDAEKALQTGKETLEDPIAKTIGGYTDVYEELKTLPCEDGKVVRKIIVFVDDLDRCVQPKAFALLEALKAFMDIEGFMFVLGLDPRAIGTYVSIKYGQNFVTADEYLEKMFQVSFHLPRPSRLNVRGVLDALLKARTDDWAKNVQQYLVEFSDYIPQNLRQVKRIINMHQVITATRKAEELDSKVLLAYCIVQTCWPLSYWAMHSFGTAFNDVINLCRKAADSEKAINKVRTSTFVSAKLLDGLTKESQLLLINALRDDSFVKLYGMIRKSLGYDIEQEKRYIEILGWPFATEARLRSAENV